MSPIRAAVQMCLHAQHLFAVGGLFCRTLRCSSIKNCLRDVATFCMVHGFLDEDPRFKPGANVFHPDLKAALEEFERWEKAPDRREPFTADMLNAVTDGTFGVHGPDDLFTAVADWCGSGLCAGYRRSEFAQEPNVKTFDKVFKDPRGGARAFCLPDVRFQHRNGQRLTAAEALQHPVTDLTHGWLVWRWQENGQNGEERLFTAPDPSDRCSWIRFMCNIVKRFVNLCGPNDHDAPLAVCRDEHGVVRPVTAKHVEDTMRMVASKLCDLDPNEKDDAKQLKKWSCHSVRVGACVISHSVGFTDAQMQWLLRWRSVAFVVCLRNLTVSTNKQSTAVNIAAGMPNVLG